ncbi:MAG: tetratricopeptide repeat protein [Bacteroidia bacterium]|nr:tetratricopeptide repeat protein [Bacteroidia bacterium]
MKKYYILIILLLPTFVALAQKERKFVREGNKWFETGLKDTAKLDTVSFGKAEVAYRRALELKPEDHQWQFNLADALYKQKKADESAKEFGDIAEKAALPIDKSMAFHNMGNSYLAQKKLDESIATYKKALRLTPNDPETKYNLAYAMKMKKEEEKKKQQNKDKDKDKDKKDQNKDQKKDQNKDQNKDQKKDQDKQKQNKDQNKDQQKDQKQQPQQNKISKQNAEQMLQALENDEKQTQEKVKKAQALKAEKRNVEKNW